MADERSRLPHSTQAMTVPSNAQLGLNAMSVHNLQEGLTWDDGALDAHGPAVLHKPQELVCVIEQLRDDDLCASIHLCNSSVVGVDHMMTAEQSVKYEPVQLLKATSSRFKGACAHSDNGHL